MAISPHKRTTARFWVTYSCGLHAKIKLRKGQTVRHFDYALDDEGYSATTRVWNFDGEFVTAAWVSDARDCDGRITGQGMAFCPQRDLMSGSFCADMDVTFPRWQTRRVARRDHAAEAAGY